MSHRPRLAKCGRVDGARLRASGRWSPLGNGSVGIVHRRRHDAVRAYPSDPADAAPTMGALSGCPPCEPSKTAVPKLKMPPSLATSQYPFPSGVATIATTGALRWMLPVDP